MFLPCRNVVQFHINLVHPFDMQYVQSYTISFVYVCLKIKTCKLSMNEVGRALNK